MADCVGIYSPNTPWKAHCSFCKAPDISVPPPENSDGAMSVSRLILTVGSVDGWTLFLWCFLQCPSSNNSYAVWSSMFFSRTSPKKILYPVLLTGQFWCSFFFYGTSLVTTSSHVFYSDGYVSLGNNANALYGAPVIAVTRNFQYVLYTRS